VTLRQVRRAALALAALLVLAIAFLVVQARRHPPLDEFRPLTLPPAPAGSAVTVRFAGVATRLFDDGETAWMTDGFFSRPGMRQTFFGRIGPDAAAIDSALKRLGITRLAAVVPVHSHYDHAMDSPTVALRTGAVLIGSNSTMQIGFGAGLPRAQLYEVHAGEAVALGKFRLTFIASRHSPTPWSDGVSVENIAAPVVPPTRAPAWREGQVWSIVVEHASGGRWLIEGSAGFIPGALAGRRVDTVFLGVGTLGRKDDAYRSAYWHETVRLTGARRVVPIHWDDFWLPLDQPLQAMPLLFDDFGVTMADLSRRAKQDGVELRLPPLFTPFAP
jgi:L-ascorbate metabolism protein UlaG (beta-lactamase superfamily)